MRVVIAGLLLGACVPSAAKAAEDPPLLNGPALGGDIFVSSDADETEVVRVGTYADIRHSGPESYLGFRLEKAWFNPVNSGWRGMERAYVRAAAPIGEWKAAATVGTDTRTVLASINVHDESKFRKEFFVERDIVETKKGVDDGIYYTFVGGALDVPFDDRNVVTLVSGMQFFTGDNIRFHVRANYVHVIDPDRGLSFQIRARYFDNSHPREFDYYSPRWYAQVVPVLQLRRNIGGWQYTVAGGIGAQKDNSGGWTRSSLLTGQFRSPERNRWSFNVSGTFSETPTATGNSYNYFQTTIGVLRRF